MSVEAEPGVMSLPGKEPQTWPAPPKERGMKQDLPQPQREPALPTPDPALRPPELKSQFKPLGSWCFVQQL